MGAQGTLLVRFNFPSSQPPRIFSRACNQGATIGGLCGEGERAECTILELQEGGDVRDKLAIAGNGMSISHG